VSRDIVARVHRLGSTLVNWYVVEDGGRLTAVDAGLPGFAGTLSSDLGSLGLAPGDVEAVILTHSDSDHTGLTRALRAAGARVLIHSEDEPTLRRPRPKSGDGSPAKVLRQTWRPALWRFFGAMMRGGGTKPSKIDTAQTFAHGDLLDVPGRPRVIATPGHTPGHCAFLFESHAALFVGDELCTWNPLTGRLGAQVMPTVFNTSTDQCFESLAALEALQADVVLPGHGDPWRQGAAAAVQNARKVGRT
jgi:glyoxylase-like metal-dependent hydrolase (beta-lactamase superfamily II)